MAALWQLDAALLAQGFARGDFSPVDALQSCLSRIEACQPQVNAFVHVDAASALGAAQASHQRWAARQALGPLDGVPLSLKDNLHAQGMPTSWGSRLLQGYRPPGDELPVARLRAAGAVFLGKTNLPEFAMQGYTANLVAGVTRNPWDLALTPGGSSGGAAAAVACGCGPLALATDGGGSTRRPAAYTGLVGFKPSGAQVARAGGLPEIFGAYEVVGMLARTVDDAAAMAAAAGHAQGRLLAEARAPAVPRILYVPRFAHHPVDAGIAGRVRAAARQLEGLGCTVEESPGFGAAQDIHALWPLLSSAGLAWLVENAHRFAEFRLPPGGAPDLALCGPAARALLRDARAPRSSVLSDVRAAAAALEAQLAAVFERHDFILTPAAAAVPWAADEAYPASVGGQAVGPGGHGVFTAFANAAGLPAIALPCGLDEGLPVGLQLVGPAGADAALLALARRFQQACPWPLPWLASTTTIP